MQDEQITDAEFELFRAMLSRVAGISLSPAKKPLLCGRLSKRLRHYGLTSYGDYFKLISGAQAGNEFQVALDLLTTNETYFFREPKHFEFLRNEILPAVNPGRTFRLWCGASSTGEEPYSLAMTLADGLGKQPWDIVASDICTRVLEKARTGHYAMERMENIPPQHLSRYCLRGVGANEGTFLVSPELRSRVRFMQINLNAPLPKLGEFDAIFLRNVLIYFSPETKRQVVMRMLPLLRPGGVFIVGHSESLSGIVDGLSAVRPSIYRKP